MSIVEHQQRPSRASDSFGCQLNKLTVNQAANGAAISIYRKASSGDRIGQVHTFGSSEGFLIGLSVSSGHERRLIHEHHTTQHRFNHGSIYIRDLANDYRADLRGTFDFMLFQIPRAVLRDFADDADTENHELVEQIGTEDPFLEHLCRSLSPALSDPSGSSQLYLDLMCRAVGTHITQRYGRTNIGTNSRWRTLSTLSVSRAKEYLESSLAGDVSMKDAAASLSMSPALFIKTFREATGMTPHKWVVQRRLDKAVTFLENTDLSISEIALACGFTDQSHFARVFSAHKGTSPRKWRMRD